jgi:hypothetical protein
VGAAVDGGAAAPAGFDDVAVLDEVRRGPQRAQPDGEAFDVTALVAADLDPMPAQGRPSWRAPPPIPPARQFGGRDPHHETVAVLGQKMPEVGEPGFLAVALAEEPRITVGCRGVAIVPTRLAAEVGRAVPPATATTDRLQLVAGSSASTPRPRPECRRPRGAHLRAAGGPRAGSAPRR